MSIFDEDKIDCHCHLFDPACFPYSPRAPFHPSGGEIATLDQMELVFSAYGVRRALIVQPNSGYETDNSCLLAALEAGGGRFKGVAVVDLSISRAELEALKVRGVVGVAFNLPMHGADYYRSSHALLEKLAELDLFLQVQAAGDEWLALSSLLDGSIVRLLFDHCGRPNPGEGVGQAGFQKLLDYGRSGRAAVKLSGCSKFSGNPHPYDDARPFVEALLDAFTPDNCVWGSDWPFLRPPERIDYGPLLKLAESWLPDPETRRRVFWSTPMRLFRFEAAD